MYIYIHIYLCFFIYIYMYVCVQRFVRIQLLSNYPHKRRNTQT